MNKMLSIALKLYKNGPRDKMHILLEFTFKNLFFYMKKGYWTLIKKIAISEVNKIFHKI